MWRAWLLPHLGRPADILGFPMARRYLSDVLQSAAHSATTLTDLGWAILPGDIQTWEMVFREMKWLREGAKAPSCKLLVAHLIRCGMVLDMSLIHEVLTTAPENILSAADECAAVMVAALPPGTAQDQLVTASKFYLVGHSLMVALSACNYVRTMHAMAAAGARPIASAQGVAPLVALLSLPRVLQTKPYDKYTLAPATVKSLVAAGADVHTPLAESGLTPLHLASVMEAGDVRMAVVGILLDAGANPDAYSVFGFTPLGLANCTREGRARSLQAVTTVPELRLAALKATGRSFFVGSPVIKALLVGDHDKVGFVVLGSLVLMWLHRSRSAQITTSSGLRQTVGLCHAASMAMAGRRF
jgi:hypothetical protein